MDRNIGKMKCLRSINGCNRGDRISNETTRKIVCTISYKNCKELQGNMETS